MQHHMKNEKNTMIDILLNLAELEDLIGDWEEAVMNLEKAQILDKKYGDSKRFNLFQQKIIDIEKRTERWNSDEKEIIPDGTDVIEPTMERMEKYERDVKEEILNKVVVPKKTCIDKNIASLEALEDPNSSKILIKVKPEYMTRLNLTILKGLVSNNRRG